MTRSLLLLALVGTVLVGCDSSADEAPPPIPPAAFALDTDSFPSEGARTSAEANYLNAAARVAIVSTVIGSRLALPVRATEVVTRDVPTVNDEGDWNWRGTTNAFGTSVDLRLKGRPEGGEVRWGLYSEATGREPFTIYTATTTPSGNAGTWRLYQPDVDGAVLLADFDVRDLDDREVTFRVPFSRPNGGSTVRYATDGSRQTFDWVDQPEGERAVIVWDRETRAGSITADTYNDGARACWDDRLRDVDC